jgi:cytochrome c-type biogenesis protein CcmH/NrfG
MVEGLAKRLESNPEDGASWLLLAKSYKHLGLVPDAIAAYSRAAALGKTDTDLAALSGIQTPIIQ